jgi:1-acyl-sn-glycerol-3-phosphate acyltransferase
MKGRARRYWFYWVASGAVHIGLKIWERFESRGGENVPRTGGCVIASNHVSFLDPPAVCCGMRHRVVRFLARDTLFKPGIPRWFLLNVACVPLDRTRGDVGALRTAIGLLRDGHVIALFPEGTRSPDGELKPAKGGVGFLIAKAAVPVVPAYVDGSYAAYPKGAKRIKRGKVRIFYGKPIEPSEFAQFGHSRDAYDKIGQLVMSRIAALKAENTGR